MSEQKYYVDRNGNYFTDSNGNKFYIVSVINNVIFIQNELGWFEGIVYKSKIDNNTHSPLEKPNDWEEIS